jgi:hypothetical protein
LISYLCCDTDNCLLVAIFKERLAVSKQATQKIDMERFKLKKLNDVEGKGQHCNKILERFATSENYMIMWLLIRPGKLLKRTSKLRPKRV